MKMWRMLLVLLGAGVALPPAAVAQSADPLSAGAAYYFLLGRQHESNGRIADAIAAHAHAVRLAPDSAEVRAELAGLYARQERVTDAVETAEEALTRDPDNREANRIIGSIYAALAEQQRPLRPGDNPAGYAVRAVEALERVRRSGAPDLGIDFMLGRLYLQSGSPDRAIPLLQRVANEQPAYAEAALLLASAQEAAGLTADAIETLQSAVERNPRSFRGLVLLAELSEKRGEWGQAADAYARAQQLTTRRTDLTARRAAALINAGQAASARDLLRDGAMQDDADPLLLYLFAAAERQSGDLDAAEATARRLRAAAPDDPRGLHVMAQILEARGDVAGAERALRDLLQRNPSDATALNHLGYMFAERGERLDEAVELIERALAVDPGNPAFLDSLGWAYYQQGRFDLADGPLTEAAGRMPGNSVIQDHLGDLRFKQERFAEAAEAWERSLAGDGESIDRARIEKKIRDARFQMDPR